MVNINSALAELDEWADNEVRSDQTTNQESDNAQGEQPCLQQHQIKSLLRLARSIKGAPLPISALPIIPR